MQRGKSQEEQQRLDDPSYAEKQRGQQYTAEQAQLKSTGMYQYDPVADTVRDLQTRELNYVGNELKSAGRGAKNLANQFVDLLNCEQRADAADRCKSAD